MSELSPTHAEPRFVAQVLRARAGDLGSLLAGKLLAGSADLEARFRPFAQEKWREHYTHRLLDLAAAIDAGKPDVFGAHAAWAGAAFAARDIPPSDLALSYEVMLRELPGEVAAEDAGLIREYVQRALAELAKPRCEASAPFDVRCPHGRLAASYLMAILEGDRVTAADLVLSAVAKGLSVREAYIHVLMPAQRELGRMWHLNEVTVAEEHFATATTQCVMARLQPMAERKPSNGRSVLAACVEGNVHDLGVRVLADFFEFAGWRAIALGANVPSEEIAGAARDFGVDVVAISAALSVHLVHVEAAIGLIREQAGAKPPKIIVGGSGFVGCEECWKQLGADGYAADVDAAVELAERLIGLRP